MAKVGEDGGTGEARAAGATAGSERERVCSVPFCPIGLATQVLQQAAPEATAHLLKAAQELLLALRAVVDAWTEEERRSGERLERIEIS